MTAIINVHPKAESERPRDIYPSVLKDRTSINLAALYAGGHVLHNSQVRNIRVAEHNMIRFLAGSKSSSGLVSVI
jgi:hypothetical protein